MKPTRGLVFLLALFLAACATLAPGSGGREGKRLWTAAHLALRAENFRAADSLFTRLATAHPRTEEGHEALFFLGEMRMDPRNPGWNSRLAAEYLRRYLARGDSSPRAEIHRQPEASTFLELANQLNLPAGQRIGALQPGTTRVEVPQQQAPVPQRVVPSEEAAALRTEIERLRAQVAERDETIQRQRDELNRIRNTLAPGRRP
ncbi:MAG: hypothetical protein ABW277_22300 [Longimicrobiaceae bacterium]|jgi:hypothetical protein